MCMMNSLTTFPPSVAAARHRLDAFAPNAARYASTRNFDHGPGQHTSVSTLSPYLKLRVLDEIAVTRTILDHHTPAAADKFIAEVFWRTYWKGWMELRPAVWDMYRSDVKRLGNDIQTQSGLRSRWEEACLGRTGIAPFDAWAHELVETGYLHNHARMWFASIWIFTLQLPWQLGADFFLRHLLDGDAAVNTLSWRWVAGIQTRGKTYLARPDNIAKYTSGRFGTVTGLAKHAPAQDAPDAPSATPLPDCARFSLTGRYGIATHGDDVNMAPLLAQAPAPSALGFLDDAAGHSPLKMAPHVGEFRWNMAVDMTPKAETLTRLFSVQDIAGWAATHRLDQIIIPYAPVGPSREIWQAYAHLEGALPVRQIRRPFDTTAWPLATKGFFAFKKHIPDLIGQMILV